jgi:hypothetical protein
MPHGPPPTGICLVRIEAQAATFLITVRQNLDIRSVSGESVTSYSQVEHALEAVRRFLEQFTASSGPSPEVGAEGGPAHGA